MNSEFLVCEHCSTFISLMNPFGLVQWSSNVSPLAEFSAFPNQFLKFSERAWIRSRKMQNRAIEIDSLSTTNYSRFSFFLSLRPLLSLFSLAIAPRTNIESISRSRDNAERGDSRHELSSKKREFARKNSPQVRRRRRWRRAFYAFTSYWEEGRSYNFQFTDSAAKKCASWLHRVSWKLN